MIAFGDGRTHVATLLEDDAGELADWLNRYLPVAVADLFVRPPAWRELSIAGPGNRVFAVPTPNWPPPPPLAFNRLYWPTGATRWAHCFLLANTERKDRILAFANPSGEATDGAGTLTIAPNGWEGELSPNGIVEDQNGIVGLNAQMYVLPPRRIVVPALEGSRTDTALSEGLWIVPLVDRRYFWQHDHVPGGYDPETWINAFALILDGLGVSYGTPSDFDAGFQTPNLPSLEYHNAAVMLDALAWSTGRRIVAGFDGTITVETPDEASETLTTNREGPHQQIAGGDTVHDGPIVPAAVILAFPSGVVSEAATAHGHAEYQAGTAHVVHAPIDDIGASERSDLAAAFAGAFYNWIGERYDESYAGIKDWNPCGYDDAIEIDFRLGKATTRVRTLPYNWGATTLIAQATEQKGESTFPPGVSCNEGICGDGIPVGSAVCCKSFDEWEVEIPPFGTQRFSYVSGEIWETEEFSRVCTDGEDTYKFRRTLADNADGTFTSTIELVRTSDPVVCPEFCLVYETCCLPRCQCQQPHKLKYHAGLRCCLDENGNIASWICLKPVTTVASGHDCSSGNVPDEIPATMLVNFGNGLTADNAACVTMTGDDVPLQFDIPRAVDGTVPAFITCAPTLLDLNEPCLIWGATIAGATGCASSGNYIVMFGITQRSGVNVLFLVVACPGCSGMYVEYRASLPASWDPNTTPVTLTLQTSNPHDKCGDWPDEITVRPGDAPLQDGLCTTACDDIYGGGGGGGGGGSCGGTCTLTWSAALSKWSASGTGTSFNCAGDCGSGVCQCGHPGRDGAYDGELVIVDCACCSDDLFNVCGQA